MTLKIVLSFFTIAFFLSSTTLEGFYTDKQFKFSNTVLRDVIGIASINHLSRVRRRPVDPTMKCFEKLGNKFEPITSVLYKETNPLDIDFMMNYKYWIAEKIDKYIQIVIDPYKNKRIWIELEEGDSYYMYPTRKKK